MIDVKRPFIRNLPPRVYYVRRRFFGGRGCSLAGIRLSHALRGGVVIAEECRASREVPSWTPSLRTGNLACGRMSIARRPSETGPFRAIVFCELVFCELVCCKVGGCERGFCELGFFELLLQA